MIAVGVKLERIAFAAVDAAHDEVDALQTFERLQVYAVAGGTHVAGLDQQVAEVAREIGVAEIVLVMRAGREQGDARIAPAAELRQVRLHALEERGEPERIARLEEIAGEMRVHDAIGERVADARRRLGVVVDDAPVAIHLARNVDGVELHMPGCRLDALAGAQVGGIGEDQRRRNEAFAHQALLAVDVGDDRVEQTRTLDEGRLERAPFVACKDQRDEIDVPALSRPRRVGENIVRDAHLAHAAIETVGALRLLLGRQIG